ncbi:hypothetical protein CEP52_009336 [Fusarium oligoseptatum]|uniref:Uncharacterized protein n=1 Tax=Fusarium oligoseptatum TaxID=2604345 RepID=A0A428TDK3_9HYPO|nr:hypothetical protein CEP52_009336 [Fusarium oligoseptatum]
MNWIEQGPVFDITEDELLEAVNMHKRFCMPLVAPRVVLTDLPNFDDITQYGVSEEIQQHLWSNEIARLLGAITSPETLAFKGSKALAIGSKSSYEMLAAMADHVWEALNIAAYDGESLLATDVKELCKVDLLKSSRFVLVYLCGKEEDDDAPGIEDLFNFVDYLTAVLAQILCDAAEGKLFHLHILAQLVKLSAKIKTVSRRLQACAQISIEKGISDRKIDELDTEPLPEGMRGLQGELASLDSSSKKDSMRSVYYLQCAKYRHGIFDLLRFVLVPLRRTDKLTSNSATPYEFCSAVYGMRFERFRTLVYQDHENDFSGTSDASTINCARGSFRRLWAAVLHVRRFGSTYCQPPFTTTRDSSGTHSQSESIAIDHHDRLVGTRIVWGRGLVHSEMSPTHRTIFIESMSHIITVMIPFIMTSPIIACSMSEFITTASFTKRRYERHGEPIKPYAFDGYSTFFSITTLLPTENSAGRPIEWSWNPPSSSIFTGIGYEVRFPLDPRPASDNDLAMLGPIRRHQAKLDKSSNKMKTWVLEEKGVMVRCKPFVLMLMLLCTILVVGGVSIGVAVGDRITGVDPFNITTYCWVIAAFILLVAKNVRVQNWPWNDFLHGRVLCKSISELSSVTGVNEQLILAKLLQDESISVLQTRGPYNKVFNRKSADGFSIDRPLSTWAMLLGGLIMIVVEFERETGLVCLDLRRGTKCGLIQNMCVYESDGGEFIHCPRLPNEQDEEAYEGANRIRLEKGNLVWLRTLGFYGNKKAVFI